jgi:hypothetical protein
VFATNRKLPACDILCGTFLFIGTASYRRRVSARA